MNDEPIFNRTGIVIFYENLLLLVIKLQNSLFHHFYWKKYFKSVKRQIVPLQFPCCIFINILTDMHPKIANHNKYVKEVNNLNRPENGFLY